MKPNKILLALSLIVSVGLLTQCEKKFDDRDDIILADDDSDKPEWAGKDGEGDNPHPSTNPSPGITKGGDYGDLYELLRTDDGVAIMTNDYGDGTEWFVQPVNVDGVALTLNEEGELIDPTQAIAVEFGRLNIVRSPPSVLDQAFAESMKVLTGAGVDGRVVHNISLDFCGRLTSEYSDDGGDHIFKTIDSPRENMAIYKEIMQNFFTPRLAFLEGYGFDPLTIAASCFAGGSDKTGTVIEDELIYINGFMECAGLVPIVNANEYDSNGDLREYFNFTAYGFVYDRSVYGTRYIQYLVDEYGYHAPDPVTGLSAGPVYTILDVFEGNVFPYYGNGRFTDRWDDVDHVIAAELFALAIDDAVQVLEYIHEDSNVRFVDFDGNPL
ncbi:MAG: hypothetical protein KAI08_06700 [Bacteroidales bacterium]|nr:hypothetical protein [Bacteroidales bacterium]